MADLIDRDALLKDMGLTDAVKYGNKDSEQQTRSYSTWMSYEIADAIQDAPAVNRWIPCSERLPEGYELVLVTWVNHEPADCYAHIKDKPFTGAAHYHNGLWWWESQCCEDYLAEYGKSEIDAFDEGIEVIAWMPVPPAYEPGKE